MIQDVYFVVNANSNIGFGHLKRCLLLADEFFKEKINSVFLSFSNSLEAENNIKEQGYNFVLIKEHEYDPNTYVSAVIFKKKSLLIFDTDDQNFYSESFQKEIYSKGVRFMYITISNKPYFYSHFVLNQNIIALDQLFKTEKYTNLLLGPQYFILEDNFKKIQPNKNLKKEFPLNILISFGSADPGNITEKVLHLLEDKMTYINKLFIVIGALNDRVEFIKKSKLIEFYPDKCIVFVDTKEMHEIMKQTDLAICSAGLTFWELTLFKIPTLVISGSKREKKVAEYLKEKKYCHYIGSFDEASWKTKWKERLDIYFHKNENLVFNTEKLYKAINVNGKEKLVKKIIKQYGSFSF